jgi:hypothetical protein
MAQPDRISSFSVSIRIVDRWTEVKDDPQPRGRGSGSVKDRLVPLAEDSAQIRPPCALTIPLAMYSPRPDPTELVARAFQ